MNTDINPSFKSAPWCFNGHVHTILCSQLFTSPLLPLERIKIDTPDNDFIELDILNHFDKNPVIVLFHGLEGHSRRYYMTQLASHLKQRGNNVILMNFRGCGSRLNLQKRFYHSGETDDLDTVFKWIDLHFPHSSIGAAGFSLGASALFNYLKKYGTHHPVVAAVGVSVPYELKKGSLNLEVGFNRIYNHFFLKTLTEKLDAKRNYFQDLPRFNGSTLYEFDDQVTAPVHGFENADHYYNSCSSAYFMNEIQTRTLIIHSREDPLCPFRWTPIKEIEKNKNLISCFTEEGGHVGFWSMPPGWLNETIGNFFSDYLKPQFG